MEGEDREDEEYAVYSAAIEYAVSNRVFDSLLGQCSTIPICRMAGGTPPFLGNILRHQRLRLQEAEERRQRGGSPPPPEPEPRGALQRIAAWWRAQNTTTADCPFDPALLEALEDIVARGDPTLDPEWKSIEERTRRGEDVALDFPPGIERFGRKCLEDRLRLSTAYALTNKGALALSRVGLDAQRTTAVVGVSSVATGEAWLLRKRGGVWRVEECLASWLH